MALGKEIGDFSCKITSSSFSDDGATIDCDGTATNFGTILGTLTLSGPPGARIGAASWRGNAFLENGEVLGAVGEGAYEALGNHKWRTRLVITISDGQILASDGELDLAIRSLKGKNLEWS
ncbi:MAG: hypothetical protein V3V67_04070 [Myxococcota bacterium]